MDTCDSYTLLKECKKYKYKGDIFVWCNDCADEEGE